MQKYSVNQHLIETILSWVKSGEIMDMSFDDLYEFLDLRRKLREYYFKL